VNLLVIAFLASFSIAALGQPRSQVKTDPQVVAKLAQLLEKSGYSYKKAADNVWVVNFKGKSLSDINVFVTSAEGLIVIGAVVAPKRSIKPNGEMMFKLLRLVHEIDRVKIGFDDDEDLFLRTEVSSKCFEIEDFKSSLDQISGGADRIHASIKSYLVK
jgi:hypothetical protein